MKINNLRRGGVLLVLSLILNVVLLGIAIVGEKHGHAYEKALVKRGIIRKESVKKDSVQQESKYSPDYWAIVGWTNTLEKMRIECDAVFFGNSITRGSDFQKYFPELSIVNLGYSGDNLLGMYERVRMVKAVSPKSIFIMAGTNDLFSCSEEQYVERYTKLLNTIRDSIPQARVVIESVLPMNHSKKAEAPSNMKIVSANKAIEELAGSYGFDFINLYDLYVEDGELPVSLTSDGVHLYPQAYDRWVEAIKPYLRLK